MVSFHISGLWRKKKKEKSRPKFFGILRSVAEGKQTYFFFGLMAPEHIQQAKYRSMRVMQPKDNAVHINYTPMHHIILLDALQIIILIYAYKNEVTHMAYLAL